MAEGCENAPARFARGPRPGLRGIATPGSQRLEAQRRSAPAPRTARRWPGRLDAAGAEASAAAPWPSSKALGPGGSCSPWRRGPGTRPQRSPAPRRTPRLPGPPSSGVGSPPSCAAARVRSDERHPDSCGALEAGITQARACGTRVIETFATGLEHDGTAGRAALTTPWSNAQAEGQVTRLKLVERRSHGRAGFTLPRRRVPHAPRSTQNDEEPPTEGKINHRVSSCEDD